MSPGSLTVVGTGIQFGTQMTPEARAVIQIGIVIGGADGDFDKDEQAVVREACFALDVGAISTVVESEFGFHVIKRNQ